MRKAKYILLSLALTAMLTACSNSDADEANKRAKENTQKVEDMESEEIFVFKEEDSAVILTKYNGKDSNVEIPEEYNGKPVTVITDTAFEDYGNLESITIPCTINTIYEETLPESEQITLKVYNHSMGEIYAIQRDLPYEYLGENPAQASYVTIYDKKGAVGYQFYPGAEPEEEFLTGVTFEQVDGKSILTLDNCDIGAIVVEEFASLTIEVKEGTNNYITGAKGKDGIYTSGNLTITGAGILNVFGSDTYSYREGDASYVGYGICTYGNLTLDNHVQVIAKSGESAGKPMVGILIDNGNLIINESKLEVFAVPQTEDAVGGAGILLYQYGMEQYGKLELTNAVIAEGGQMVPIMESETDSTLYGYGIGSEAVIVMTTDELLGEFEGYSGASLYVRIEPQLTQ